MYFYVCLPERERGGISKTPVLKGIKASKLICIPKFVTLSSIEPPGPCSVCDWVDSFICMNNFLAYSRILLESKSSKLISTNKLIFQFTRYNCENEMRYSRQLIWSLKLKYICVRGATAHLNPSVNTLSRRMECSKIDINFKKMSPRCSENFGPNPT